MQLWRRLSEGNSPALRVNVGSIIKESSIRGKKLVLKDVQTVEMKNTRKKEKKQIVSELSNVCLCLPLSLHPI